VCKNRSTFSHPHSPYFEIVCHTLDLACQGIDGERSPVFVTAHAAYHNSIIGLSSQLRAILTQERVDIPCIDGGPGSDILGFLKFLLSQTEKPQLTFFILDKEPVWCENRLVPLSKNLAGYRVLERQV
jgi:hypothetical protein